VSRDHLLTVLLDIWDNHKGDMAKLVGAALAARRIADIAVFSSLKICQRGAPT